MSHGQLGVMPTWLPYGRSQGAVARLSNPTVFLQDLDEARTVRVAISKLSVARRISEEFGTKRLIVSPIVG
jgi:hypothetical protein